MPEFFTPVQSGVGNPLAHFGEEVFNPVLEDLEQGAYYQSGWYKLVGWTTLALDTAQISITGISQIWRHLRVMGLFRGSQGATTTDLEFTFNIGDTYFYNSTRFANSAVSFENGAAAVEMRIVANTSPADHYSPVIVDIHNYRNSDMRPVICHGGAHASDADAGMHYVYTVGSVRGTDAINRILINTEGSNIEAGSMYALYAKDR